jgi:glycosyltransferase involved in cell wall biosynthesis
VNSPYSLHIIGHTDESLRWHPQGIGEIINAKILSQYLDRLPINYHGTIDAHQWLEQENPLAQLQTNGTLFLCTYPKITSQVIRQGLHQGRPTIGRAYAMQEFDNVQSHLFDQCDIVTTQSLLASQLAHEGGIPRWKILYVPYQLPPSFSPVLFHDPSFKSAYLQELAQRNHKKIRLDAETLIVGCSSRFEYRKNVEYLLWAFENIYSKAPQALLILKGDFDAHMDCNEGEGYSQHLAALLERVQQQPWFLWDRQRRSFEETLKIYQIFDLCVHLSGAEDPGNVAIEQIALGKPLLILNGGTRPYLFKNAACFVEHAGYSHMRQGNWLFFIPDKEDLENKLLWLMTDHSARQELGERAKHLADNRFGPEITQSKIQLMIEAAHHFHFHTDQSAIYRQRILDEWECDQERFDIDLTRVL